MATDLSTDPGSRRRHSIGVLTALLATLAAVTVYQFWPSPVPPGGVPGRSRTGAADDRARLGDAPPAVRLDTVQAEGARISTSGRNPFRFQSRSVVTPVQPGPGPAMPRPEAPPAPGAVSAGPQGSVTGEAPPPPITLKFIGTIEAPGVGKIAALSDGKFVYHGREGEVIEGRYRIVKIGVESIVMEYVDGRGRQTIRLTG